MAVENIVINFEVDSSQIDTALERLIKTGQIDQQVGNAFKQTNGEIIKQATAIKNVGSASTPIKKNLEDVSKASKKASQEFMIGFQEGIVDTLKEAGVSLDQFEAAMAGTGERVASSTQTVKAELRELIETIARAKANGEDYGESYDALVIKAGRLKDAVGDVNQEIGNVASDTSGFDGLISLASGAAGVFSAVQGAAALFGDESEELQEVLLRVNAAMAIAQGLQQVQTVLQKESAGARLLDIIATKGQTAAQTLYNIVIGESTGALKGFRIALAATGIGLFVLALGYVISKLSEASDAQRGWNDQIEKTSTMIEENIRSIQFAGDIAAKQAEVEGRKGIEVSKIRLKAIQDEVNQLKFKRDQTSIIAIQAKADRDTEREDYLKLQAALEKADKEYTDALQREKLAQLDILIEEKDERDKLQKELADKAKEAARKTAEIREKAAKEARDKRESEINDELAALERQLLAVQKGGQPEADLLKQIVAKKAELELNAEKLTANQVLLIKEKSADDQLKIQEELNTKLNTSSLQNIISNNTAQLQQLNISNAEKLRLTIENIATTAQLEINAAEGNAAKIAAINAKKESEIAAAKRQRIQNDLQYELDLTDIREAALKRALENIVADEKAAVASRISAEKQLLDFRLGAIGKQIASLQSEKEQKLINDEDYILRYKKLLDDKAKSTEETEKKITAITKAQAQKRLEDDLRTATQIIDITSQHIALLNALYDAQAERENQRIELERNRVAEQLQAGQITEKEAKARQIRIDAEERRIKYEQARRDKQIAIFTSIINTASAVVRALGSAAPPYNFILAAIVGALGAAQTAVIASKPIPRFAKGKKKGDQYEGLGYIGEAGAELYERDGKLYVTSKPTIVYLGKKDVVYNPKETKSFFDKSSSLVEKSNTSMHTKEFLEKALQLNTSSFFEKVIQTKSVFGGTTHTVNKQVINYREPQIDIKKLSALYAQETAKLEKVIKKMPLTNLTLDENGFNKSIQEGINRTNYFGKYYGSGGWNGNK